MCSRGRSCPVSTAHSWTFQCSPFQALFSAWEAGFLSRNLLRPAAARFSPATFPVGSTRPRDLGAKVSSLSSFREEECITSIPSFLTCSWLTIPQPPLTGQCRVSPLFHAQKNQPLATEEDGLKHLPKRSLHVVQPRQEARSRNHICCAADVWRIADTRRSIQESRTTSHSTDFLGSSRDLPSHCFWNISFSPEMVNAYFQERSSAFHRLS